MKKSVIFASVIAIVAMLAVSCKPAVEKPKARINYEVEDLTVKFNADASKDAETYEWNFGDGSLFSKEKNPTHKYADYGKYTVTLKVTNKGGEDSSSETVELAKKAWEIKIDGNFSDWDNVAASDLAVAELDENGTLDGLYKIKFCTDADKIYFYAEWTDEAGIVGPFSILLNTDDNAETGFACWMWNNCGADILIQGEPEAFAEAGFFKFIGATQEDWGWDPIEVAEAIEASEVKLANSTPGYKAFECSIRRAALAGMKGLTAGVYTSDVDWAGETGALPETYVDDEGASVVPEMLEVKLN